MAHYLTSRTRSPQSVLQNKVDEYNYRERPVVPMKVRIGLNTGEGIVENDDVYGDVVNVAARMEALAKAGEIYLTKASYLALTDPYEFYCRMIRTGKVKGKKEEIEIYKVFWTDAQIHADEEQVQAEQSKSSKKHHDVQSYSRIFMWLGALVFAVLVIMKVLEFIDTRTVSSYCQLPLAFIKVIAYV